MRIQAKTGRIKEVAAETDTTRRLQTMPGVGPIVALAVEAFAPAMASFKRGRDFAPGLARSTTALLGRQGAARARLEGRPGRHPPLADHRGDVAVELARAQVHRRGIVLDRMLARKPKMLVAIALANKMARAIWAMLTKGEDYRIRH